MTGLDNMTGTQPSLVADDVLRLQRMASSPGVRMVDVAAALGVSVRTAYRYAKATVHEAEVGGHRLRFIQWHPGDRPHQLGERRHPQGFRRGEPPPRAALTA